MRDLLLGIAVTGAGFGACVLLPFGLAWALGRVLGAS
jgi:hypothetical protein